MELKRKEIINFHNLLCYMNVDKLTYQKKALIV